MGPWLSKPGQARGGHDRVRDPGKDLEVLTRSAEAVPVVMGGGALAVFALALLAGATKREEREGG